MGGGTGNPQGGGLQRAAWTRAGGPTAQTEDSRGIRACHAELKASSAGPCPPWAPLPLQTLVSSGVSCSCPWRGYFNSEAPSMSKGVRAGRPGGPTTLAGNAEPQHILLNKITAFYLHSAALQKYLFFVWLSCLFCTIPTARGRGSVVPGDARAPPACILGDPAGVMGPCCCLVASRLWVTARGLLTVPRTPVRQGLQARRAPFGVRWASGAGEGACAWKSLDRCRDPRQPSRPPRGWRISPAHLQR